MNGKELLNFANKLEDNHKDKGYKWLYDKLRYEIIKKHQEVIDFIPCCKSDSEQLLKRKRECTCSGMSDKVKCGFKCYD